MSKPATEQDGTKQGNTEQSKSEQGGTAQGNTEQSKSEQGGTAQGNTEQSKSEQGSKTSPKTGDTSNSALWILFLCFSGAALTVINLYDRKKRTTR